MPTSCSRRQSSRFALALALAFTLAAGAWPRPQRAANPQVSGKADALADVPAKSNAEIEQQAKEAYGKLGVSFEENRGQVDGRVRFLSRHGGASLFLTNDEAAFVLRAPESHDSAAGERPSPARAKSHAVRMKFEGANPRAEVIGERELPGRVNYFRGNDPSKWLTNAKTYGAVRYRGIYDGVDLVYYGNGRGEMEYDFEVAPGADPSRISLKIEGAKALEVDAAGYLVISTPVGEMRQRRPAVYQEVGGGKREVEGGYVIQPGGRVRFNLGEYDESEPLVIDPAFEYSTYLGGGSADYGTGIAVDSSGSAYVTGYTWSTDFPTADAMQGANAGYADVFVAKLNADGSALVYSTYIGGSTLDEGHGIAVDPSGSAYITGQTFSTDFPMVNAVQGVYGGGYWDSFVTKLNAAGSALVYSTYLGGSHADHGTGIAVDSSGSAYVTGYTQSPDFPATNTVHADGLFTDAFVTKLNATGSALVYSICLGGIDYDMGRGIAVDSAGDAYVTGFTSSSNFPMANPIQPVPRSSDAFVTKLNAAGSALVYSTYLGGSAADAGYGIAVDSAGSAYVTGVTRSQNFPVVNPAQGARGGRGDGFEGHDAFVTKLNAAGSALLYSTYLGGRAVDYSNGIAVDSSGSAYVTGHTRSPDFPTVNPSQADGLSEDAFVTKLNAAGSALLYSTYLGGGAYDIGRGIAVDSAGSAYVMGMTSSTDFPTVNPSQSTHGGGFEDAFVTKVSFVSIRGRVVTNSAAGVVGVPWVAVKLTDTFTTTKLTNARGYYSFTDLPLGGDYTITPSKTNLSFVPASRTFTDLRANVDDINFTVPSLSVNNVAVAEGDAGDVEATFTVKLTPASGEPVTFSYQTMNGTFNPATAGADYTALPSTQLTFAPGETEKTVTVQVKGDALDEPNETLFLRLSAPTNAIISDHTGVCMINDDDAAPSIAISDRRVTEPDAGTVNAVFTVRLSAASGRNVSVKYRTADGTAAAPADYTAPALTTLMFSPGQTTKYVTVQVNGDKEKEGNEDFFVKLSNAVNATIADAQGQGKITDDD